MSERVTKGDAILAHYHHASRSACGIIMESFPDLFGDDGDVSVGIGWAGPVSTLCAALQVYSPEIQVSQIKTKFGSLRIYYAPRTKLPEPEMLTAIREFESISHEICELCGANAKTRRRNMWVVTCCDVCADTIGAT